MPASFCPEGVGVQLAADRDRVIWCEAPVNSVDTVSGVSVPRGFTTTASPIASKLRSYGLRPESKAQRLFAIYISTCVPNSITRLYGSLKKRRLPLAFFSMKANSPSRQRAMPASLVDTTVSRLRK
mgnify:CR=1 FL=1